MQRVTERTKRPPLVRGRGRNLVRRLRDSFRFYEKLHRDYGPIGVFFGNGIDVDADDLESASKYVQGISR